MSSPRQRSTGGKVYLVGAGPGDPGLMTLRGAECLGRADLVLYDYLANDSLLSHARKGAELVCLGRHGHGRMMSQQEVNQRMIAAAKVGLNVVRLKGGDPLVFARAAEECDALHAADVPFEVVPGITVALAAGSYAGIPLTHRELASAVALVAGREDDDKDHSQLDYAALARFPGTLVFYMGVTTAPEWTQALQSGGLSADTPAAIVRRCSWPDQTTYRTTLGEVVSVIQQQRLRPPVVVIVGRVAELQPVASWFTARPLFGQQIVVTRPIDQADSLVDRFEELGAQVLVQPAIEIGPPSDWQPVDSALARLTDFDWLVFSSANGVRYLLDRAFETADARRFGSIRLAAIGPGTAAELNRYGLKADLVAAEHRAEGLASELIAALDDGHGRRVLLARASRGREVLAEQLGAAGAVVEQVVVYDSRDVTSADPAVVAALAAGTIDWMTVTSSAIARSLVALFGEQLQKTRLSSISPITTQTLHELGYVASAEATDYTTEGVVEAILRAET